MDHRKEPDMPMKHGAIVFGIWLTHLTVVAVDIPQGGSDNQQNTEYRERTGRLYIHCNSWPESNNPDDHGRRLSGSATTGVRP